MTSKWIVNYKQIDPGMLQHEECGLSGTKFKNTGPLHGLNCISYRSSPSLTIRFQIFCG